MPQQYDQVFVKKKSPGGSSDEMYSV